MYLLFLHRDCIGKYNTFKKSYKGTTNFAYMQAFGDFFEKLSDLSRLKGHRVPIGSSLTDRRSGTFEDRR